MALHILRSLREWSFAPWLVNFVREGDFVSHIPEFVRVADLHPTRASRFRYDFFRNVWALGRLCRAEKPDMVIGIITHENIKVALTSWIFRCGAKVVLIDQTSIVGWMKGDLPRWWLWKRLIKRLYAKADVVVAASKGIADELVGLGVPHAKVTTIHNPVPIEEVREMSLEPVDIALPVKESILVSVGGFRKQKGYPYLFEALALVRKEIPCGLALVGDGPDRDSLRTLAEDLSLDSQIQFLGFRENPYAYMARADAFVLPSLWEGFGIVVIEAMACGVPVIATTCPEGPREIITDEVDGLLVPPADSNALAAAILRVLRDVKLRERLVKNASRRVEDFGYDKIMGQYRLLFDKTLAG